ncbi:MAG: T9SS type A sorting domain-containing protein [Bacteroidota bacterium]
MSPNQYNNNLSIPLNNLLNYFINSDTIDDNEYFYVRCELTTLRNYGSQSSLYKKSSENFHSFTNPIWIKRPSITTAVNNAEYFVFNTSLYPNPFDQQSQLDFSISNATDVSISIFDITGKEQVVYSEKNCPAGKHSVKLLSEQPDGFWLIKIKAGDQQKVMKAVKTK